MTTDDYLLVALAAVGIAFLVNLLWRDRHDCNERYCPHRHKGGVK